MKAQKLVIVMVAASAFARLALPGNAQQVTMQVDASKMGSLPKMLYGFFSELLSNMYEGGLWAEMLGDRKFFYPVNSSPSKRLRNMPVREPVETSRSGCRT